jgi:hypothetical protein
MTTNSSKTSGGSVILIDSRVTGYQTLIDRLATAGEVFIIDAESDGVAQIAAKLQGRSDIGALHIISHGSQGALYLGSTVLNGGNLSMYALHLGNIGRALTQSGDVLLYGCNVAQGDVGVPFVNELALAIGADVAASDDATGGALTAGNLDLEVHSGQINSELPVLTHLPILLAADMKPPKLTSLTFPTSIDVIGGDVSVTFSAKASNEGSSIKDVVVRFDKNLAYKELFTSSMWGLYSGWTDATPFEASSTWTVSSMNISGTYNIKNVDITDITGNKRTYTPTELASLGINTSFTIAGKSNDATPPNLTSLTFPTNIDVTGGDISVAFAAQASDKGYAIKDVVVWFDKNLTSQIGTSSLWGLYSGWTDATPFEASATWTVSRLNDPGTYNISKVVVTDLADNKRTYTPTELANLGISTSFTLSGSTIDTTPPSLKNLTFPTNIDASSGDVSVTFSAQATDTGSAIKNVVVWFDKNLTYQIGTFNLWGISNGWSDATPDEASATWTVSSLNNPGTYNISKVDVTDLADNKRTYTPTELASLGFSTSFTVKNGSPINEMGVTSTRTGNFIDLKISASIWSANSNTISLKLDYDATNAQWVSASEGSSGSYSLTTNATSTSTKGSVTISGSISNNGDNTEFLNLRFSLVPGTTTPFGYSFTNVNINAQGLGAITGSFPIEVINSPPTGGVTIAGTANQGQTLTASNTLADADGLGTISYQWMAGGANITGATNSAYILTQAEVGKTISVTASYVDLFGHSESVSSAATSPVVAPAKYWKDAIKTPSETNKAGAVNLTDAISILKMIVGLSVNANASPLSPYQAVAADFDQSGAVDLTDAIGVLKMVVGLNAPAPTWKYFDDVQLASAYNATQSLNHKTWSAGAAVDASSTTDTTVKLVGVLTGDVDGSWAG